VLLTGALCGVVGMLPHLGRDSGKLPRELFGVTAALLSFVRLRRLRRAGVSGEGSFLLAGAIDVGARWGSDWLLHHLTVHRAMFPSLPAAGTAASAGDTLKSEIAQSCHLRRSACKNVRS
jgi:hypothetical protein